MTNPDGHRLTSSAVRSNSWWSWLTSSAIAFGKEVPGCAAHRRSVGAGKRQRQGCDWADQELVEVPGGEAGAA